MDDSFRRSGGLDPLDCRYLVVRSEDLVEGEMMDVNLQLQQMARLGFAQEVGIRWQVLDMG